MTVDLVERTVTAGGFSTTFEIDDYTRWRLMEGLDDIGLTLRQEDAITEFEKSRPSYKPATLPVKTLPAVEVVSARPVDGEAPLA